MAMTVEAETGTTSTGWAEVSDEDPVDPGVAAVGPESEGLWVDAAPFRAHVRHLMAVGSLGPYEVAVLTGVSTRSVLHLLEGRPGRRPPRRISPEIGCRLLKTDAEDVLELWSRLAPSDAPRAALSRLTAAGWTAADVSVSTGVGLGELAALRWDTHCTRLLAVRVVALARTLPGTLDDEHVRELSTAA